MKLLRLFFCLLIALLAPFAPARAQQASPPARLAEDLCSCIGAIDPASADATLDLAVRHCLSTAMMAHSREVMQIMLRFPMQERKYFLLGMVLGSSLDRACPQYPMVRERLRGLLPAASEQVPNT